MRSYCIVQAEVLTPKALKPAEAAALRRVASVMMENTGVPYSDLKSQYQGIKAEIDAAVSRVLDTCQFVLGPEVALFEEEFGRYSGTAECVALNSGTSALHLALVAAGVG